MRAWARDERNPTVMAFQSVGGLGIAGQLSESKTNSRIGSPRYLRVDSANVTHPSLAYATPSRLSPSGKSGGESHR